MEEDEQIERGIALGAWVTKQRGDRSVRLIARHAGFSESYLRIIERGYELKKGHRLPVQPSHDILAHLGDALTVDRAEVFTRGGRLNAKNPPPKRGGE
jgi:hypothetical protein